MNKSGNTTAQWNTDKMDSLSKATIACKVVLGLWAIIGNTISLVIFLKTKSLRRRRSNYLLVNLCIADLLVGIYCVIGSLEALLSWRIHIVVLACLKVFSSHLSVNFLAAVSVERLVAVAFPFYHRGTGKTFYVLLIGTPWLLAGISTVTTAVLPHVNSYIAAMISVTFYSIYVFLPLLIIPVAYTVIMIRSRGSHINGHGARERLRDKKLAVTLLIVTLASLVTWMPFHCYLVISLFNPWHFDYSAFTPLNMLQISNSCINIVVYAWRIPEFRQVLFRHKPVVATNVKVEQ